MRDEFVRFQKYKNRVALRFRVRCVSTFKGSYTPDAARQFRQRGAASHKIDIVVLLLIVHTRRNATNFHRAILKGSPSERSYSRREGIRKVLTNQREVGNDTNLLPEKMAVSPTDERLILLVQNFKELYDKTHAYYKDVQLKENIWISISEELHIDGECTECRKMHLDSRSYVYF